MNTGTILYFVKRLPDNREQPLKLIFPDGHVEDADNEGNIDMSRCAYYIDSIIKIHTLIEESGRTIVQNYKLTKFGIDKNKIQYISMEDL